MSRIQAYTILIICNIFGALGVFGGMQVYLHARNSADWPTVDGKIISIEVHAHYTDSVRSRRVFDAEMLYAYSVEGRDYQGDRHTFRPQERSKSEAEAIVKKYPVDCNIQVYYSPQNPQQSVLEPGSSSGMLIPVIMGGLIMAFPTIFVIAVAGRELLPRVVSLWLDVKFPRNIKGDTSTIGKKPIVPWAENIRESIVQWEPGRRIILEKIRTNSIELLFYSTIIGAFLGIAGGIIFTFATKSSVSDLLVNNVIIIFSASTLLLFIISRFQDRQLIVTLDWELARFTVKRDFNRNREGSIHDIKDVIVRCIHPKKHVQRFRANIELQLPEEIVAIAQTSQLRREPADVRNNADFLAVPLAESLGVIAIYNGFDDKTA